MHKAHLVIGGMFLLVFLATGWYMLANFPGLYEGREEIRMMYRATHIYILMGVMVNLMAANYLRSAPDVKIKNNSVWRWLKGLASVLIFLSPFLFTVAFFVEPPNFLIERPISFLVVIALFVGVMIHTAINFIENRCE